MTRGMYEVMIAIDASITPNQLSDLVRCLWSDKAIYFNGIVGIESEDDTGSVEFYARHDEGLITFCTERRRSAELKATEKWLRRSKFRYVKHVSTYEWRGKERGYYWKPPMRAPFEFSCGRGLDPVFTASHIRALSNTGELEMALSLAEELDSERSDFRLRLNW